MILAVLAVWLFVSLVGLAWLLAYWPVAKRRSMQYMAVLLLAFSSYFVSTWALVHVITNQNTTLTTVAPHGGQGGG